MLNKPQKLAITISKQGFFWLGHLPLEWNREKTSIQMKWTLGRLVTTGVFGTLSALRMFAYVYDLACFFVVSPKNLRLQNYNPGVAGIHICSACLIFTILFKMVFPFLRDPSLLSTINEFLEKSLNLEAGTK